MYRNTIYKTVFTQDNKQPTQTLNPNNSIQYTDKSPPHGGKKHSISLRNLEMKKYKQKEIKPNMGLISAGVATQELSAGSASSSKRNREVNQSITDVYRPTGSKRIKSTILEKQRSYANNSTSNLEGFAKKNKQGLGSISVESI